MCVFPLPGRSLDSDFVGCPGKLSVLNAGWFVLKPSCHHFEALTQLLKHDGGHWTKEQGWGHALPGWLSSEGTSMKVKHTDESGARNP